jgi:hypothetical protein
MIPILIASGGPPAPAALWAICAWDLLWCATAAALLSTSVRRTTAPA